MQLKRQHKQEKKREVLANIRTRKYLS